MQVHTGHRDTRTGLGVWLGVAFDGDGDDSLGCQRPFRARACLTGVAGRAVFLGGVGCSGGRDARCISMGGGVFAGDDGVFCMRKGVNGGNTNWR
jgi:hypothetical protein